MLGGIATNIPWIEDKLARLTLIADRGFGKDVHRMMRGTVRKVKSLTPKSDRRVTALSRVGRSRKTGRFSRRHVRDGWTYKTIGGGAKDRIPMLAVVYNQFTHDQNGKPKASALMRSASGMVKRYTLLEILEYGSRPHTIVPAKRWKRNQVGRLVFEVDGKVVFAKRVSHPGTRPYGMVRLSRLYLKRKLNQQMRVWVRRIEKAFGKPSGR